MWTNNVILPIFVCEPACTQAGCWWHWTLQRSYNSVLGAERPRRNWLLDSTVSQM